MLFADEDERIRNVARLLVDCRINRQRRQLMMLLAEGHSQAEIARRLGVSRQAIFKAVASESFKRVFTMYQFGDPPHRQSELLNLQLADGYSASASALICDR